MDNLHQMFPEDEIFLAGIVLLYGIILGGVVRLVMSLRERRNA